MSPVDSTNLASGHEQATEISFLKPHSLDAVPLSPGPPMTPADRKVILAYSAGTISECGDFYLVGSLGSHWRGRERKYEVVTSTHRTMTGKRLHQ
jgi:hypothetical protein